MASEIDICNMALSHIRGGSIGSFTERSVQAIQCNLFYKTVRDSVLEDAPWGFATRIRGLSQLDPDSFDVFNWAFVYQYPSDCVRINRLILNYEQVNSSSSFVSNRFYEFENYPAPNLRRPVEYEVFDISGTTVIAANDSELRINYNTRMEDPTKFSSKFSLALSHLLASYIAVPVAGEEKGKSLQKSQLSLYSAMINSATSKTLNERHVPPADSEFITIMS